MTASQPEIHLVDVEKELNTLWERRKEKNLIKATLFNLIIYVEDKVKTQSLQEMVKTIVEKYPCRILFILCNTDPTKNLLQTTVANIIVGKGSNAIACDQINIEASPQQLYRVPFILLPLFIPDLPIYLLWGKDPTAEANILPHLRPYAARLIFDSDCTQNLQAFSKKMLQELEDGQLEIRDINWIATSPWREIIAHIFNTEEKISTLKLSKNIRIEFNRSYDNCISHPEIQAIYLQGWMASCMGWKFHSYKEESSTKNFTYLQGDNSLSIELIPQVLESEMAGNILSIEINTDIENIKIIASNNPPKATVHITSKESCEMPYSLPLPDLHKGIFLIQELFYRHTSSHYHNMLSLIAQSNTKKDFL